MILLMIVLFLLGYFCIAAEHSLKVDKAAPALLLSAILWTCYVFCADSILPNDVEFQHYIARNFGIEHGTEAWQAFLAAPDFHSSIIGYVTGVQIIEHLGDVASILFFLMGAMTIVELVDVHGGFTLITDKITTRNKVVLMWMLVCITFIMSAILDNLTTTIVMVMLLSKIIANKKERWLYACMIIIAANSGGAFSPIGDVTTIMLWVKGNVTTGGLLPNLILPSIVSVVVPVLIVCIGLKGDVQSVVNKKSEDGGHHGLEADNSKKRALLIMGVGALVFVPVFKSITHLPPFIGVLLGLGVLWVYTDLIYNNKATQSDNMAKIKRVLGRIDITTILFFLGILMAVAALQCAGILKQLSIFLDEHIGNIYAINVIIGFLSSIVDNVPLVAGAMGMYEVAQTGVFAADGTFWLFLAYCAGVGGSMLIIGSAAGVVVMGLEKVDFMWYLKKITWLAAIGYLAGAATFVLQSMLF